MYLYCRDCYSYFASISHSLYPFRLITIRHCSLPPEIPARPQFESAFTVKLGAAAGASAFTFTKACDKVGWLARQPLWRVSIIPSSKEIGSYNCSNPGKQTSYGGYAREPARRTRRPGFSKIEPYKHVITRCRKPLEAKKRIRPWRVR